MVTRKQDWVGITVNDIRKAAEFYTGAMGFKILEGNKAAVIAEKNGVVIKLVEVHK